MRTRAEVVTRKHPNLPLLREQRGRRWAPVATTRISRSTSACTSSRLLADDGVSGRGAAADGSDSAESSDLDGNVGSGDSGIGVCIGAVAERSGVVRTPRPDGAVRFP